MSWVGLELGKARNVASSLTRLVFVIYLLETFYVKNKTEQGLNMVK
jgi:hypothetical protein